MSASARPSVALCPECDKFRTLLDAALRRIADLEAEVRDLRQQRDRNSSDSSILPSTDPPGALKPVVNPSGAGSASVRNACSGATDDHWKLNRYFCFPGLSSVIPTCDTGI